MSKLASVVVKDGEFLILSAGSFVLGKASSLTHIYVWDRAATGEHLDVYCVHSQLDSLGSGKPSMFRSIGIRPLTRLSSSRCASRTSLFNPCVARSFSSTIRRYQNETDIETEIESERKWSTPLARQLSAAISVGQYTLNQSFHANH